ncbi:MAG TPA: DUF2079 domain-containing protein [Ktedonobacteraceae bacterium]|jgi:uncharacterized membrane protein
MKFPKRLDTHTQQRIAWGLVIVALAVYIAALSFQSVLRYATFKATAFDLGNMDQVLWNTIHGRPFQFTNQAIDWYGPPNRLAIHVEPIMLLVSLLYALHSDPRVLLIFQTLALAAGGPAVFLLTRRYLPSWSVLAAVMTMAYLASPALLGINIFDFHPDCLATPLLLYALLALTYRRYLWFLLLCFFVCACKEDMPLAVAFLGLLLIWKYRLPRLGLALLVGGTLWTALAFKLVIPHFYVGVQPNNFWYRYQFLGSTPLTAILNLLVHPWLIFTEIITLDRLYYVFSLLRSSGFLALLAPEWLLPALPKFASNFLSSNPPNYSGAYHYNAAIIPFIMLAALHGARRLVLLWLRWSGKPIAVAEVEPLTGLPALDTCSAPYPLEWIPMYARPLALRARQHLGRLREACRPRLARMVERLRPWLQDSGQRFSQRMYPLASNVSAYRLEGLVCLWLVFALGLNYLIALPQLNSFWADHLPGVREQQIQQILNIIPPAASVSASDDLNPHLSERENLAVFPITCLDATCDQTVDYIVVDLNNLTLANRADATAKLNQLAHQYRLLKSAYGVELFIRRSG